jgi:hypothetical protein
MLLSESSFCALQAPVATIAESLTPPVAFLGVERQCAATAAHAEPNSRIYGWVFARGALETFVLYFVITDLIFLRLTLQKCLLVGTGLFEGRSRPNPEMRGF